METRSINMEIQNVEFKFQNDHIHAHPQPIPHPEAMTEGGTLPSIVSSELNSITIAYSSNSNEDFGMDTYNYYPSEALLNIHTTATAVNGSPSPSSPSSSDNGYQSSLQPSSPSDCGSEFTELSCCLNNNTGYVNDSGNESNEAEDSDVNDPDYIPVAKKTTLGRCSKVL